MSRRIAHTASAELVVPDTRSIMLQVLLALLPGVLLYAFFISPLVLFNIGFAVIIALLFEAIAVKLIGGDIRDACTDGSIALAATLLAIAIPPTLPFWQLSVGVFIMVVLGKHVYGGIGHNPFNPAMVGYAALIISFPQSMTFWTSTGSLGDVPVLELIKIKMSLQSTAAASGTSWDVITQATPLEYLRVQRLQNTVEDVENVRTLVIQAGWVWVNSGFLLGGVFLLWRGLIRWHIPAGVLISFGLLHILLSGGPMPTHLSLFSGALLLGAFFIATDPVTTASSHRGRFFFGVGVGVLTFVIREYGGFPDGFAFAILLMNLCVPLIDHLDHAWTRETP